MCLLWLLLVGIQWRWGQPLICCRLSNHNRVSNRQFISHAVYPLHRVGRSYRFWRLISWWPHKQWRCSGEARAGYLLVWCVLIYWAGPWCNLTLRGVLCGFYWLACSLIWCQWQHIFSFLIHDNIVIFFECHLEVTGVAFSNISHY